MKHIIILTPFNRVGSTFMSLAIAQHKKFQMEYYEGYDEFINTSRRAFIMDDYSIKYGKIIDESQEKKDKRIYSTINPIISKLHYIDLVNRYDYTILFEHLKEHSDFVIMERKNLLDQILSFELAKRNNIWNMLKTRSQKYKSITIQQTTLIDYISMKERFDKIKCDIISLGTIFYEELGIQPTKSLLVRLGFNGPYLDENIHKKLTKKLLTFEQKIPLIQNWEMVSKWSDELGIKYE